MDQDLLPEGMTSRRWAATSANTRRRKSTGPKRSVALGRQLPGAVNMKPGPASSTYSRRLRWSQLTYLPDFRLTDAQWEGLLIPIQLAFFFHSSPAGRVIALYPSPAGPTESLLDLAIWD